MDFSTLVDTKRAAKAQADYDALVKAQMDATAALEAAKVAAKRAHEVAQASADRGDGAKELEAAELSVDAAERAVRSSGRLLEAAQKKRQDGALVRDHEIKHSHGNAMNQAMGRFVAIRAEAIAALARIEELKSEHVSVVAQFKAMANVAKAGVPGPIGYCHELLGNNGALMSDQEFSNRLHQGASHEWDAVAQKLRWTI